MPFPYPGNLPNPEINKTLVFSLGRGVLFHLQMLFIVLRVRVCVPSRFSCVRLLAVSGVIASQIPLSMEFSRQESWSGLPCLPPGDLPDPSMEPECLSLLRWQASSLPLALPGNPI